MAGKDNSQYMTYSWALSGHFELKVNKDRLVVNLGRLLSVGSSEKFTFKRVNIKFSNWFVKKMVSMIKVRYTCWTSTTRLTTKGLTTRGG